MNLNMNMNMNMNGLFAHSLTDLIRGIRQNKKNEQSYIAKEIADIRLELRRNDPDLKAQAIAKLTYVCGECIEGDMLPSPGRDTFLTEQFILDEADP